MPRRQGSDFILLVTGKVEDCWHTNKTGVQIGWVAQYYGEENISKYPGRAKCGKVQKRGNQSRKTLNKNMRKLI